MNWFIKLANFEIIPIRPFNDYELKLIVNNAYLYNYDLTQYRKTSYDFFYKISNLNKMKDVGKRYSEFNQILKELDPYRFEYENKNNLIFLKGPDIHGNLSVAIGNKINTYKFPKEDSKNLALEYCHKIKNSINNPNNLNNILDEIDKFLL